MLNLFASKTATKKISPREALHLMENDKNILLIDVRTMEEYHTVRIPNSISVPLDNLKSKIEKIAPNKDAQLMIYCQGGVRASAACKELDKMGYTNIYNLGGIMNWPFDTVKGGK